MSLQVIGVRLATSTIEWLDTLRWPGESRSSVIRRVLEELEKKLNLREEPTPVSSAPITWTFPSK